MNSTGEPEFEDEAARVARIYRKYGYSRRRQRTWAAENPGNVAMRRELLRALRRLAGPRLDGGDRILDAGCGGGYWLNELIHLGVEPSALHGVDIVPGRVAAAQAVHPALRVAVADVRSLPFEDESFKLILAFTVLSSLPTAEAIVIAIAEMRRVLAPNGLLLCYEPRIANPFNRDTRLVRAREFDAAGLRPREELAVTVLPPLSRRLGRTAPTLYPRLAAVPLLRSHRLMAFRKPLAAPVNRGPVN